MKNSKLREIIIFDYFPSRKGIERNLLFLMFLYSNEEDDDEIRLYKMR